MTQWTAFSQSLSNYAAARLIEPRSTRKSLSPSPTGRGLGCGLTGHPNLIELTSTRYRAESGLSCVTILLSDESLSRSLPLSVLCQVRFNKSSLGAQALFPGSSHKGEGRKTHRMLAGSQNRRPDPDFYVVTAANPCLLRAARSESTRPAARNADRER